MPSVAKPTLDGCWTMIATVQLYRPVPCLCVWMCVCLRTPMSNTKVGAQAQSFGSVTVHLVPLLSCHSPQTRCNWPSRWSACSHFFYFLLEPPSPVLGRQCVLSFPFFSRNLRFRGTFLRNHHIAFRVCLAIAFFGISVYINVRDGKWIVQPRIFPLQISTPTTKNSWSQQYDSRH